jgi:hypothetical protein
MQQPFGVKALAHASRRVSEFPVPARRWQSGPQKAGKPQAFHDLPSTDVPRPRGVRGFVNF